MGALDKAKLVADIAKVVAEVYGILTDKDIAKKNDDKDRRIAKLEAELDELKRRLDKGT